MHGNMRPEEANPSSPSQRPRLRIALCAAYALVLITLGLVGVMPIRLSALALADFSDADRLLGYGVRVAVAVLLNLICFGVLGGMVARLPEPPSRFSSGFKTMLSSALIAWAFATIVVVCRYGWPNVAHAAVPWCGSLAGVWVVGLWRGGVWGRRSVVLQGVALAIGIPALVWCSLDTQPLPFSAPDVSSADKRHLVELVRGHEVQQRSVGPVHVLELNQREVELLANWGLQVADGHPTRSKSSVQLAAEGFTLQMSLWLRDPLERFLNVQAQGTSEVNRGELSLRLQRVRVGHVEIPSLLLPVLAMGMKSYIHSEEELAAVLSRTELIHISADELSVELEQGAFRDQILSDLEFVEPHVRLATIAQLQCLSQVFQANHSSPTFETCLLASFTLAAQRTSAEGARATDENRAALYALGIMMGHTRLGELLLGPQFDEASYRAAKMSVARVPLRGRRDLTRHFAVSAALSSFTNEKLSDAAGLLKEELDAGPSGSGFSFVDLLADRAGSRFAQSATQDEASARLLQGRLAKSWTLDDLFPPITDLPEGLSDSELEELGGIGGQRYQEIIRDIEQRLDRCQLLR